MAEIVPLEAVRETLSLERMTTDFQIASPEAFDRLVISVMLVIDGVLADRESKKHQIAHFREVLKLMEDDENTLARSVLEAWMKDNA